MLRIFFSIFMVFCLMQSCCYDKSFPIINQSSSVLVQVKDINNNYFNLKIKSIEWLGANYIQQIAADTANELTLNVKSNQTQFKINHENGSDTIIFDYTWDTVTYKKSCYAINDKMERKIRNVFVKSNKGTIVKNGSIYTLKLN